MLERKRLLVTALALFMLALVVRAQELDIKESFDEQKKAFSIPYKGLVKFSAAKTLAIRLGDTSFPLTNDLPLLRKFVSTL